MSFLRSERGATVTEVAFLLPVLIIFVMTVMEGGRVLGAWMVLTNSTRETVRYVITAQQQAAARNACLSGQTVNWTCVEQTVLTPQITNYEQGLVGHMLNNAPLVVTPTYANGPGGSLSAVTVSASYAIHPATPIMQAIVPVFNLSTTATMRAES